MAVLNQRLYRYNGSSYDTIHFEAGADNITGTLPVAHGGTGSTTAADALTALGAAASNHTHSNYASISHSHAAGDITSGTLPVARGGTGATSRLDAAKVLTNEAVTSPNYFVGLTSNWSTFGYVTAANTLTAIGALPAAGGTISGNLAVSGNATMKTSTDYTIYRARNIAANTTAFTAGTTALTNGNIYLQYET